MIREKIKRVISYVSIVAILSISLCLLPGCQTKQTTDGMVIYYLNTQETKLVTEGYELEGTRLVDQIDELINKLSSLPASGGFLVPISEDNPLISRNLEGKILTLNFSEEYYRMSPSKEVLVRAAIVQTLMQLDGISYIYFNVENEPLKDAKGLTVGKMNAETFIYNDGNAINTYDEVVVKLYFANENGDKLIGAYRDKFYSTNIPMELFVVQELLSGPSGQILGLYATINPETKIISVLTSDSVCYVNLSAEFLTPPGNVTLEDSVYSIVNSLTELGNVSKVQILINGEILNTFDTSSFEYNDNIVTVIEDTLSNQDEQIENIEEAQ